MATVRLSGVALLAAFFLCCSTAWAFDAKQYESQIERGMRDWQIPGLATAVIENGEVVYARGFGVTATDAGTAVTADTPFAIASTTKAMLVAGLLMQVDAGKLSLDEPVVEWIPELRFADPSLAAKLTLRDLLAHRTGLPETNFLRFQQGMSIEEQLGRLPYISPVVQPRTRLIYQNTMYELAGMVLERVTGQPWGEYLAQNLWAPLAMTHTAASRGRLPAELPQAKPHDVFDGNLRGVTYSRPPMETNAAGSVWSTVNDMTRWAQFLLRGGVTESGVRLLSEDAFAEFFEPAQLAQPSDFYPTVQLSKPKWRSYALGWFQQDFMGRRVDFHTGSLRGLVAILGLDRDADRAVIVFANRDHAELRHALMLHALDPTPDEDKRDWHSEVWQLYAANKEKANNRWQGRIAGRIDGASSPLPLNSYLGEFESDAWGELSVVAQEDALSLQMRNISLTMTHWQNSTFLAEHPDWQRGVFVEFRIGPNGAISALEMNGMMFTPTPDDDGSDS